MNGEWLKGHLDLLLLAVVAARPAHGYAVVEALRAQSGGAFDLPEGTIYPALHRLERAGLLHSHWTQAGGRRRRMYEITALGRQAAAERTRAWQTFAAGVGAVLRGTA